MEKMEKPIFPMRINKFLALNGHSTRRGADELIIKKKVFINGRFAVLGDKVNETDEVTVQTRGRIKKLLYFAYNKPKGIITHSPGRGEKDIKHSISIKGVFPIGRLDKDSHGLIILSNDGRITDRLLNPDRQHEKEYLVRTVSKLHPSFKENMEKGVNIDSYLTKPCQVKILNDHFFSIILSEGKNRQIRRMVSTFHNEVVDLQRVKIMNIDLGKLPVGSYRAIEGKELEDFLGDLGL